jgi:hypothetical protein
MVSETPLQYDGDEEGYICKTLQRSSEKLQSKRISFLILQLCTTRVYIVSRMEPWDLYECGSTVLTLIAVEITVEKS